MLHDPTAMGKDDQQDSKRSGGLAPEDAELWERVARTAKPLRKGKNRVVEQPEVPESAPPRQVSKRQPVAKTGGAPVEAERSRRSIPSLASIDKREARSLGIGRVSVDARIDLHGARQLEAHRMLTSFLARAQADGHRYVLVITGKGGRRDEGAAPTRGVLNREVPRWLSEPEFRQWVVSFSPAQKRHGGEGALYVRIRRGNPS